MARLDRALVNTDWNSCFPNSSLKSMIKPTLDHVPLLLSASTNIPRPFIFRLNNHWLASSSFSALISNNWFSVNADHPHAVTSSALLCLRLKQNRSAARYWAKRQRPIEVSISNCDLVIAVLDLLEERRLLSHLESALRSFVRLSLRRLCDLRAAYRRQRGKVKQCVLGDENTSYHHQCATIRFQRNKIKSLVVNDTPVFGHSAKASILHDFYS